MENKEIERIDAVVIDWNDSRGTGYLMDSDGNKWFIHYSMIDKAGFKTLLVGQRVKADIIKNSIDRIVMKVYD